MSDYTVTTDFSAKDLLSSGDPEKLIIGSDFDTEFDNIQTAVGTKYDSDDLASQAQAEAETANTVLMTPLRVANWADANAGVVGGLQAISGLAAGGDKLFFFDDTDDTAKALTVGTGLAITGTTIASDDANIAHDSLSGFVANEHIDHSGVSVIAASNSGLNTSNNDLTSNIGLEIDLTGLTQMTAADIAGADEFVVDDGGTNKALRWQDFGIPQTDDATTTPMSAADLTYANRWFNCNNASAISFVIPANASVAYPVGTTFAIHQRGAGQVTVSVTTDTLRSPNGAKTAQQYSTIFVTKVASTEWVVTGDSSS